VAEPIKMPFESRTLVVPRKHVLDGVQISIGRGHFRERGGPV